MTKGDNNKPNDRGLYDENRGLRNWLNRKHVFGRIVGFLPYLGIVTILLNDYPMLKWTILAIMAIMTLTNNDPNEN